MKNSKRSKKSETGKIKNPYFEIQAEIGVTKHGGGRSATDKLAVLCKIDSDSYVLDVGCGPGMSSCHIAENYGCKVVGIDISEKMIQHARERANRKGLEDIVEFKVADAQNLPFEEGLFDVVISESVTAFLDDKTRGISEYARVLKSSGYVGINEITWMGEPDLDVADFMKRAMGGVVPETMSSWIGLLENGGFHEITALNYEMKIFRQWLNEVRGLEARDYMRFTLKLLSLIVKSNEYRSIMKDMVKDSLSIPKRFLKSWGYGIYVGKK
ncbi:Methyltransferase domain-containing protein [Peptoclostridium litorale DSM 5388]|uniref:Methylase involved in ubiquinone/menaquinone biosynthesis n=1 Tax=Peptoclostridium litorale DSM 5388 TaxID=1121324 RepID=A0A069RER2_PEPLI|nr:class I SAM-dependent methyltransferase [Peptoclostridium litorale]KDR95516.1 methylase involved in ubiquinone/menaquinone biosynthesis [Peptoclostridium litorale DSM 5388]SIO17023.1 Methyltransferase domain-containing protein [Peptoclostridium litorale DSM 5388]